MISEYTISSEKRERVISALLIIVTLFSMTSCKKNQQTDGSGISSEQSQVQGQTQGPPPV